MLKSIRLLRHVDNGLHRPEMASPPTERLGGSLSAFRLGTSPSATRRGVAWDDGPGSRGVSDPPGRFPKEHFGSYLSCFSFVFRVEVTTKDTKSTKDLRSHSLQPKNLHALPRPLARPQSRVTEFHFYHSSHALGQDLMKNHHYPRRLHPRGRDSRGFNRFFAPRRRWGAPPVPLRLWPWW